MPKLVTIATYQFVAEAELMQSALGEQNIAAYLADDNLISMDWLMSNAVGGVKLQVAAEDVASAKEVVEQFDRQRQQRQQQAVGEQPIRFACENCGLPIQFPAQRRGGVETCPECGRYVDVPE